MTAQELRIGNWIRDLAGYECQVRGVTFRGIWLHNEGGPGPEIAFTPIPLTHEWLEMFRFEHIVNYLEDFYAIDYDEGVCTFGLEKDNEGWFIIGYINTHGAIKYVHQLQNLYFALTGQELELK